MALTIGAAVAAIFGLLLVLAPAQLLAGFGLGAPTEGVIVSRDVGATLLGLAVINWLGRSAVGAGLRAIIVGNIVVQVLEIVVNGYEVLIGALPAQAAGGLIIHLVIGAIFASALMRPEAEPEAAAMAAGSR